ncbi:hypothetical protein CHARACLAT_016152 [Characodon lateralis]|uniref:Uncharacterized protein n=1 Tax=Characodon lateralis TaxID=208331 RepID=A0ABU7CNL8_9TELE|nr:hypothetical protein [Characodon lateralis]
MKAVQHIHHQRLPILQVMLSAQLLSFRRNTPIHWWPFLVILTMLHYVLNFQRFNSLSAALPEETKCWISFMQTSRDSYMLQKHKARPPLAKSDHNLVFLCMKYK